MSFRTTNCYGLSTYRDTTPIPFAKFPYNELLWFIDQLPFTFRYVVPVSVQRIVMVYLHFKFQVFGSPNCFRTTNCYGLSFLDVEDII